MSERPTMGLMFPGMASEPGAIRLLLAYKRCSLSKLIRCCWSAGWQANRPDPRSESPLSKRKHEQLGYQKAHMARTGSLIANMEWQDRLPEALAKASAKACATHTLSLATHACSCSKFTLHCAQHWRSQLVNPADANETQLKTACAAAAAAPCSGAVASGWLQTEGTMRSPCLLPTCS